MNLALADQTYAIQARKHIAALRRAKPDIITEIRWCPARKGVLGNEKADEWAGAKLAAEHPDARGGEWKHYTGRYGRRPMSLERALTHLKRGNWEKKWQEAKAWADLRVTGKKYQHCRRGKVRQKPDPAPAPAPAKSNERLAARFYQSKTSHCLTGQYLKWTKSRATATC